MNEMPLATFTINCAGCYKTVTHPCNGLGDPEFRIEQIISKEGWIRRDFGPNARIWFCGTQCAHYSYTAIQCEEWWRKYNQEKEFPLYKIVFYTVLTVAAILMAAFGLQYLIGR